jgi:hypothetical protein
MDDDMTANPAGDDDTRLDEAAPFEAGAEAFDADDDMTEPPGDGEGEDEDVDPYDDPDAGDAMAQVDYEGQSYEVPRELKDALLRQADYTRKTMELSEQRKALAADRAEVALLESAKIEEFQAIMRIEQIRHEVEQLAQRDWSAIDPNHPELAQLRARIGELGREEALLCGALNDHHHQKTARAQQEAARTRAETDQAMMREIQNWSPEQRRVLDNFAIHHGISEDDLDHASPAEIRLLHLAHFGAQQMERQRAANRGAYRPAAEVGGSAGGGPSDPSRMTMAQYRAWRAKQK